MSTTSFTGEKEDGLHEQRFSPPPGFTGETLGSLDHNRNLLVPPVRRQGVGVAGSTDIQRFYSGASVLVTGATGFMGKVLIEKLLRSCPDIDSIYMMVREKKGRSLDERIDDVISSPCFDRIKRERPDFRSHLRAVAGDIGLEGLGLSEEDRHSLQQQVNIVFHVAATVRFDEHFKFAILQNVRGTREVLSLCRTFRNLRAVVHVSTAYSNCPEVQIDERFYDPLWPSDHMINLAESHDVITLDRLLHKLVGKWPNTYSLTKALSEDVVRHHGQGLPVVVFRPSIVVSTDSEPMAGWIDNMYGPSGVLAAGAAGVLRTMQADATNEANIVPCDMAINALIASAWDVAENRTLQADVPVYNYIAPSDNPLIWADYHYFYLRYALEHPTNQAMWYWTMTLCSNRIVYLIYRFFLHILPAMLMDMFFLATNRKPQMMRMYAKIHKFIDVIAYFSTSRWKFEDSNVVDLWKKLGKLDQEMFFFDMRSLNWEEHIKKSSPGVRTYLLKDPCDTLPAAKIRMQRLYLLHRFTQCLLAGLIMWLSLVSLSSIVSSYSNHAPLETLSIMKYTSLT